MKPVGPRCNLSCSYCYYIGKQDLLETSGFGIMPDDILEKYIKDHFLAAGRQDVFFSWHGGEPLLAGLDFYRRALSLQAKHNTWQVTVRNGIQTNGTLIDEEWCSFFSREKFYVGISIDGEPSDHDKNRLTSAGKGSSAIVEDSIRRLVRHGVETELLCTVNKQNVSSPIETYRHLKTLGARFITFLPVVDTVSLKHGRGPGFSVLPDEFGNFLCAVFDEWLSFDIGTVKIQIIEEALRTAFGQGHTLCIFKKTCGTVPVIEHDGELYSCDHYVDDGYRIGNISQGSLASYLDSERQQSFGREKERLPSACMKCEVLSMCNGECPRNRILKSKPGEPGLNYLCSGYKKFFLHVTPFIAAVSAEWRRKS
ncbi:MAG: anaerobic sulfatase maturase [Bacteroidales bacterium]